METQAFYKPECKLIGEDGNVFYIIGKVTRTLKEFGYPDKAKEFQEKAFASQNYYNVLNLVEEYVKIV